jgi:dihydroorotate dehydrogenase
MSLLESFAAVEHRLRSVVGNLPPRMAVRLFSSGRTAFAGRFAKDVPAERFVPSNDLSVTAWGLRFRLPLWNAAGMFKKGEGYGVVSAHGAGAYVAGTTTSRVRTGNLRDGVRWPAIPYPHSHAGSNWMGLPNEGHAVVAERLQRLERVDGCPVGASVSAEPGLEEAAAVGELVDGLKRYEAAGVDYIELNESCPNVPGHHGGVALDDALLHRLDTVAVSFLAKRARPLPVVAKFSTDTSLEQIPELVQVLIERGFDGIILGNTSVRYAAHRSAIDERDRALFDHFTSTYGGGLSGRILRADSLAACARAVEAARSIDASREFHVIRCGGVGGADDVLASRSVGVLLNQWYVGYFEAFAAHGHGVYRDVASRLRASR